MIFSFIPSCTFDLRFRRFRLQADSRQLLGKLAIPNCRDHLKNPLFRQNSFLEIWLIEKNKSAPISTISAAVST